MVERLSPSADQALWSAYAISDRELRTRQALIGCVLTLVFVPAGFSLDYFIYPQQIGQIFAGRMLCDLLVLPIFALLFTRVGRRWIGALGLLWPLVPAATIAWMEAITQGAASPYYAGLNLVIIVACVLMPYTWREAAAVSALTLAAYLVAVFGHHQMIAPGSPWFMRDLFGNGYFIILTGIITSTAAHWSRRRRVEDFRLRHQLDAQNRELQESYRRLAELDRLRGQFFANISHELRTPLTLIIAPLEDLLAKPAALPAPVVASLAIARQNSLRLLRLINDLLELVRLDAGQRTAIKEKIELGAAVRGLADSMRYLATAKGVELTCVAPEDVLPWIGDASRLEKIALNLLSNAIKFTAAGGRITVTCQRRDTCAELLVADTGVGIPASELPHIFDRFRQVDGSPTRKYQGAGIGLSLVKELVEEQGGTINAVSHLGVGTTMTVSLPLGVAEPAISAARSTHLLAPAEVGNTTPVPDQPAPDQLQRIYQQADRSGSLVVDVSVHVDEDIALGTGPATVLVVDDEPDMRHYLATRLAERFKVHQCGDGHRAIAMATRLRPDVILLDVMLPGIDGLGVCRALRSDPALGDTRIILLTARMDDEVRLVALRDGADDFLTKPFSTPEVLARTTTQVRAVQLSRSLRERGDELSRTLNQLRHTETQLVHSEKMSALGVLSAGILHEVSNPLNYVGNALQFSRSQLADNSAAREGVEDALEGIERIRLIVKDLGAFAHRNVMALTERVVIAEAIALALRLCAHELRGQEVVVEAPAELAVRGSHTQLSQVLVNLLINAARACRGAERPTSITVAVRSSDDHLVLTVHDTGSGVPEAALQHIFEPFFTTQEPGSGTGLGLAICHTIITAHGGTINATSQPGRWTIMTVILPNHSEDSFLT